jgi:urocanate hydratase
MLMVFNNLDSQVAQFPQELVTYGGNGQVFSNWAQVRTVWAQKKDTQKSKIYIFF